MAAQPTKRCSSSLHVGDEPLPLTKFQRRQASPDGHHPWCKTCLNKGLRERYATDSAYREKRKKLSREWGQENREQVTQRVAIWKAKNLARFKKVDRRWREENRERLRLANRRWHERNRERSRELARQRYYRNKERYHALVITRRARIRDNGGRVTKAQLAARWTYYAGKCWMCGAAAECWDHVKPVAKGGGSWASNLRPACQTCNKKKRDTWPWPPVS